MYISGHFAKKQGFGLFGRKSFHFEQALAAEVDLFADGVAVGENKEDIRAVLHYDLGESFEVFLVLGGHDCLAVVQHDQHFLALQLLGQPMGVLGRSFVEFELWSLKQFQIEHFVHFGHGFTPAQLQIYDSVLEVVPNKKIPD